MSNAHRHYNRLLRENALHASTDTDSGTGSRRVKRRRVVEKKDNSPIELSVSTPQPKEPNETTSPDAVDVLDQSSDDSFDSDEFEDVELDNDNEIYVLPDEKEHHAESEVLTISLNQTQPESGNNKKKQPRRFHPISKEERLYRKLIHQVYLVAMMAHGSIRNNWCNDKDLQRVLKGMVPRPIVSLLHPEIGTLIADTAVKEVVYSRRFLDGIRDLMLFYKKRFKVSSKGIIYKNWHELGIRQKYTLKNVDFHKFSGLVQRMRGSRDIGAQGFLCLVRSLNLTARLVYSIQAPDLTLIASNESLKAADDKSNSNTPEPEEVVSQSTIKGNQKHLTRKDALLQELVGPTYTGRSKATESVDFEDSSYPIFWVEIWNKYTKKWISVDPIVLHLVEVSPMRRRSKFEVPLREPRNYLTYVLAYDKEGGVMDVTRRYTQYYNAKIYKKRIEFKSEEDAEWYSRTLRALNAPRRRDKLSELDIRELKEFRERDLAEGMPPNVADFKNHPMYALESQLRQNEVIYPKDKSSESGKYRVSTIVNKKKTEKVVTVYKRSHVYELKSAKAWYMRGRVLKMGVQPLKVKQRAPNKMHEDPDDDGVTRLYAQFQTQIYVPPAIINGVIPRNAYGNIDIYTPSMIPENGYLISVEDTDYTIKQMVDAGRILGIDYAKAVIQFDFKNRKSNKMPTVKEGGVVIDVRFKEGMLAVLENLAEQDAEAKRMQTQENALKNWKFFLTKLRIQARLNREHGRVSESGKHDGYNDPIGSLSDSDNQEQQGADYANEGGFLYEDLEEDNVLDEYSVHSENSASEVESGKETQLVTKRYNTRNKDKVQGHVHYAEDMEDDYEEDNKLLIGGVEPTKTEKDLLTGSGEGEVNSEGSDGGGGFFAEDEPELSQDDSELMESIPQSPYDDNHHYDPEPEFVRNHMQLNSQQSPHYESGSDHEGGFLLESENDSHGGLDHSFPTTHASQQTSTLSPQKQPWDVGLTNNDHTSALDHVQEPLYEASGTPESDSVEVISIILSQAENENLDQNDSSPTFAVTTTDVISVSSQESEGDVVDLDAAEELSLQKEEQLYDFEYSESE